MCTALDAMRMRPFHTPHTRSNAAIRAAEVRFRQPRTGVRPRTIDAGRTGCGARRRAADDGVHRGVPRRRTLSAASGRSGCCWRRARCGTCRYVQGDALVGGAGAVPADFIVCGAAAEAPPPLLLALLRPGGRMVMPIGVGGAAQTLTLVDRDADVTDLTHRRLGTDDELLRGSCTTPLWMDQKVRVSADFGLATEQLAAVVLVRPRRFHAHVRGGRGEAVLLWRTAAPSV